MAHDEEWDMPFPNYAPHSSYQVPVVPPSVDPDGGTLVQIPCIAQEWIPFVLGALDQLRLPSTWAVADDDAMLTVLQRAEQLRGIIASWGACEVLAFDCLDGVPRYSTDDGATWTALPDCFTGPPGADGAEGATGPEGPPGPSVPSEPPNPAGSDTADLACNIAGYLANLVIKASLQQQVDAINASAHALDAVLGLVSLIPGLGLVVDLGIAAAFALNLFIQTTGTGVFTTALADATLWADVQCAIYEAIAADGFVTAGNFEDVHTALAAITYASADVITAIADYWEGLGLSGVQSVQAYGSLYEGDCSACGTWCYEWDFTVAEGGWALRHAPGVDGTWVAGVGYVASIDGGNLASWIRLTHAAFSVYEVAVTYLRTTTDPGHISFIHVDLSGADVYIRTGFDAASPSPQGEVFGFAVTPSDLIDVRIGAAGTSGTVVIQSIILKGPGANPFGVTNCPA